MPTTLQTLAPHFLEAYKTLYPIEKESHPTPLTNLRTLAKQAFETQGLPTQKNKTYKYTPLAKHLLPHFKQGVNPVSINKKQTPPQPHPNIKGHHINLYNGQLTPQKHPTLPKNIKTHTFSSTYPTHETKIKKYFAQQAPYKKDPFVALNTALFNQAIFLQTTPKTQLKEPLIIHHYTDGKIGAASFPRLLLLLSPHSNLQIIEIFHQLTDHPTFINRVAEIMLQEHAQLNYHTLQTSATTSLQMHYTYAHQQKNSKFTHHTTTINNKYVRNHIQTILAQKNSKTHLYGIYATNHKQYIENNTKINHKAPSTQSNQLYKGIASGKSKAVFNGNIYIHKCAEKTQATQNHHAWLLTPQATIKTRPQLEIQAQDILCTHGATISQPKETLIFYLRTRGIPKKIAYNIILKAFFTQLLQKNTLQKHLYKVLNKHLKTIETTLKK